RPSREQLVMMSKNPTAPSTTGRAETSTPGKNPARIDAIGAAMRALTTITGSEFAERFGLRQKVDRVTYEATKTGFKTLGAATKSFKKVTGGGAPKRLPDADSEARPDLFDLTLDEDQQMISETVRDFSTEVLRPAADDADHEAEAPASLLERSAE